MAFTTQSDIAKSHNFTRITVSKDLRNHPDISNEMKNKLCALASEHGYTSNLIVKNFNARKTFTIGIIIPDLENIFFAYAVELKILHSISIEEQFL